MCAAEAAQCRKAATLIITRYNVVVPGLRQEIDGKRANGTPLATTTAPQERTFGTHTRETSHPGTTALYRVMISCTHFGVLPALRKQRTPPPVATYWPYWALSPPSRRRQSGRCKAAHSSANRCRSCAQTPRGYPRRRCSQRRRTRRPRAACGSPAISATLSLPADGTPDGISTADSR